MCGDVCWQLWLNERVESGFHLPLVWSATGLTVPARELLPCLPHHLLSSFVDLMSGSLTDILTFINSGLAHLEKPFIAHTVS